MTFRYASVVLALVLSAASAFAQSSVPAELNSNRLYVPVEINGKIGRFAIDTGAGRSSLHVDHAARVGVQPTGAGKAVGAGGGPVEIKLASNVPMKIGALTVTPPQVPMLPLGAVSLRAGRSLDGILGHELFKGRIVELDYERKQVTFHDSAAFKPPKDVVRLPVDFHHGVPIVKAQVTLPDDRKLTARLIVDSGSAAGVSLTRAFWQKHRITLPASRDSSTSLGVGGAGTETVGRLQQFSVAGFAFERPLARLSHDTAGALADPNIDGLLGGAILRRFTVITDYPRKQLYLVPNANFDDPFDSDMAGLVLAARDATFSQLVVDSIIAGTPAAEAELRKGDELRSIDGTAYTPAQMDEIRELFRKADRKYVLTIARDGKEQQVEITTRRMY